MNAEHFVAWRGVDPERVEGAAIVFDGNALRARGSSVGREYALTYVLETGERWITRRLQVRVEGDGWWRALDLRRAAAGRWSAHPTGQGAPHLPPAGLAEPSVLRDALDCDLALCPLTNTPPILRYDLVTAARAGRPATVDLRMAWVSVPDLAVHVSLQRYTANGPAPADGAFTDFASEDFAAVLRVDRVGLVEHYPGVAYRLHA